MKLLCTYSIFGSDAFLQAVYDSAIWYIQIPLYLSITINYILINYIKYQMSDSPCLILTHETDNRKFKQQKNYHDIMGDYGCK